jgi:hypothetical protein
MLIIIMTLIKVKQLNYGRAMDVYYLYLMDKEWYLAQKTPLQLT